MTAGQKRGSDCRIALWENARPVWRPLGAFAFFALFAVSSCLRLCLRRNDIGVGGVAVLLPHEGKAWIPAFAGMTMLRRHDDVAPA
jgi:hypothetical protein